MTFRVLVTGSSGFTGRYVVRKLLEEGSAVLGLEETERADSPCPVLRCNLKGDTTELARELSEFCPTHVLHLAALSHVTGSDASAYYAVNVVGTENLLKAVRGSRAQLRKVVLASTANIYGNVPTSPISEDSTPSPVNHYACSKLLMEHVARAWFPELPILIARPFNYTGVGQSESFLVPKMVGHFARREQSIRLGNIEVARDISDVRFVADVYCRLLRTDKIATVVNVCSGRSVPLRSILNELQQISAHQCEVQVDETLVRRQEIADLRGDDVLLRNVLPDLPKPPRFGETLRWMYEHAVTAQKGPLSDGPSDPRSAMRPVR